MNPCACRWDPERGIVYCALHGSAPELVAAVRAILEHHGCPLGEDCAYLGPLLRAITKASV